MALFEVIPNNLFSVFNSKNKNIYVSSLFVLRQAFKQELVIEKDKLIGQLSSSLSSELLNIDIDEEEVFNDGKKLNKDATSLARFMVKRLCETGWIEIEYGVDTSFKEYIALAPYSIKIINTLYAIMKEDEEGYNTHMYSIYSNLFQADNERKDFMYTALLNAYDRTNELENDLKSLYHNIRRKFNKLSFLNSVNEVLVDHFDNYQKRIINQIYMPLKTKDSLNRFKGSITQILLKWLRKSDIIEEIEKQAFGFQKFNSLDEAREDVITKIYFIVDKLNELEEMIDRIDLKNTNYVSATTEKMKALLNNDKSIKAKMSKLSDKLADSLLDNTQDEILTHFYDNLTIQRSGFINEGSLFVRSYTSPLVSSEPLELDDGNYDHIDDIASGFIENMNNTYSHKNVIEYVENKILNNKNELESSLIKITSDQDLILTIHSMLKGWDKNIFYKIDLQEGNVDTSGYSIPKMTYLRRRKL